jgi:hydroxymethylbilane synthase
MTATGLMTLRLGTRRSALALAQSTQVASVLRAAGLGVELVEVTTAGDRDQGSLATIGGTGVFVSALRQRLTDGDVDLAVHSLKDLPSAPDPGVTLAAVPHRADPRDALISRGRVGLADLPTGAAVGTGSPRRAAQLRMIRPDLRVVDMRGNVDTRIARAITGTVDAVVLAVAGLQRLGREDEIAEWLPTDVVLPAPGQGALAVECRAADTALAEELRRRLDDPASRLAVSAERAVLRRLEAGCTAPLGALAQVDGQTITLTAVAVAADGSEAIRRASSSSLSQSATVEVAEALGRDVAEALLSAGAAGLIGETQ